MSPLLPIIGVVVLIAYAVVRAVQVYRETIRERIARRLRNLEK